MSELDLDAIRARAEAATVGPWYAVPVGIHRVFAAPDVLVLSAGRMADARFAQCARTDIPALLAEVESLRASNGQIRGDLMRLTEENARLTAKVFWLQDFDARIAYDAATKGVYDEPADAETIDDAAPTPSWYLTPLRAEGEGLCGMDAARAAQAAITLQLEAYVADRPVYRWLDESADADDAPIPARPLVHTMGPGLDATGEAGQRLPSHETGSPTQVHADEHAGPKASAFLEWLQRPQVDDAGEGRATWCVECGAWHVEIGAACGDAS